MTDFNAKNDESSIADPLRLFQKPRVILVHGFNVRDKGAKTTDRLRYYLEVEGYTDIVEFNYPWTGLLHVKLCNNAKAYILARNIATTNCIAVGHSNGCAIISQAARLGAPFSQVVYINPALDKNTELAGHVTHAHVWHSRNDKVVWFSRFLPTYSWGQMGRIGYRGRDMARHTNYETGKGLYSTEGHSDIFNPEKLHHWGPRIVKRLGM